jgi:hypothetical protein
MPTTGVHSASGGRATPSAAAEGVARRRKAALVAIASASASDFFFLLFFFQTFLRPGLIKFVQTLNDIIIIMMIMIQVDSEVAAS